MGLKNSMKSNDYNDIIVESYRLFTKNRLHREIQTVKALELPIEKMNFNKLLKYPPK